MARVHGKDSTFTVATNDLSAFVRSAVVNQSVELAEVTGFGDAAKEFIAGLEDATIAVQGAYDVAALGPEDQLQGALDAGAEVAFTLIPGGGSTYSGNGIVKSWEVSAEVADAVAFSAEIQVNGVLGVA